MISSGMLWYRHDPHMAALSQWPANTLHVAVAIPAPYLPWPYLDCIHAISQDDANLRLQPYTVFCRTVSRTSQLSVVRTACTCPEGLPGECIWQHVQGDVQALSRSTGCTGGGRCPHLVKRVDSGILRAFKVVVSGVVTVAQRTPSAGVEDLDDTKARVICNFPSDQPQVTLLACRHTHIHTHRCTESGGPATEHS